MRCRAGLLYEGSLEACALWLDADGNGELEGSELESTVEDGRIELPPQATPEILGVVYLLPADGVTRVSVGYSGVSLAGFAVLSVLRVPKDSVSVHHELDRWQGYLALHGGRILILCLPPHRLLLIGPTCVTVPSLASRKWCILHSLTGITS